MFVKYFPRSLHFIPATQIDRYSEKIPEIDADAFVFDINRDVVPAYDTASRTKLERFIREERPNKGLIVRTSAPRVRNFENDFSFALSLDPDCLFVSSVESRDEMQLLDNMLRDSGKSTQLMVSLESLRGHNRRKDILGATERLKSFVVGYEHLSSSMGITRPSIKEAGPLRSLLERSLESSREFGIPLIDSVTFRYRPESYELFREETESARDLGCWGKLSIHPSQVPVINAAYVGAEPLTGLGANVSSVRPAL